MSVSLRLTRIGKKKRPFYRIVAVDRRKARDGKYIEKLGHYDPLQSEQKVMLSKALVFKWLKVGAEPTQTLKQIFSKEGLLTEWEQVKKANETAPKKKKPRKSRYRPMADKIKLRKELKAKAERDAKYQKQKAKKIKAEADAVAAKTEETKPETVAPVKETTANITATEAIKPKASTQTTQQAKTVGTKIAKSAQDDTAKTTPSVAEKLDKQEKTEATNKKD